MQVVQGLDRRASVVSATCNAPCLNRYGCTLLNSQTSHRVTGGRPSCSSCVPSLCGRSRGLMKHIIVVEVRCLQPLQQSEVDCMEHDRHPKYGRSERQPGFGDDVQ